MTHAILVLALGLAGCDASAGAGATTEGAMDAKAVHQALAARRGTPLLVNLWAMWCPPCVAELPELAEVAEEMSKAGGAVIALNVELLRPDKDLEETVDRVPRFLERRDIDLDVWVLSDTTDQGLWQEWRLPRPRAAAGIPVTLAINAEGKIVDYIEGRGSAADFRRLMRAALGP